MAVMPEEIVIDLIVVGQPECCKKMRDAGWQYSYSEDTYCVSADHPLGGKQPVAQVSKIGRTGFECNEIGKAIALMLNGGKLPS